MDLSKAILRPGKVIEVLENGKIRADVPGLFSLEDKDKLLIIQKDMWKMNVFNSEIY